jgi:hypothetical protein
MNFWQLVFITISWINPKHLYAKIGMLNQSISFYKKLAVINSVSQAFGGLSNQLFTNS